MSESTYLLAVMGVMLVATFSTRLLPFVALKNRKDHPLLMYLGRYMPPAIMTILVIYSLKAVDLTISPYGANELIALAVTLGLHLWRGHALVSIFAGTLVYMFLLQTGVFA